MWLKIFVAVVALVAAPALVIAAPSFPGKGFKQIAHKKGVKVYLDDKADTLHVAAQAIIRATPEQVQKALLAYDKQAGKVPRLAEAKILKQGKGWLRVYQRLGLPVIDDRDFTLHVIYGADKRGRWIIYRTTDKGPGPRDGIVRIHHNVGSWRIDPVHGGKHTRLRLDNSIDIAGSVPKWAVKSGAGDDLPELYEAVCRLARSYKGKKSCLK